MSSTALFVCVLLGGAACSSGNGDTAADTVVPSTPDAESPEAGSDEAPSTTADAERVFFGATAAEACADLHEAGTPLAASDSFVRLVDQDSFAELCLGPALADGSAIESASASENRIALVFTEAGIAEFNAAARLCFDLDQACPTQRLAVVFAGRVLSAPQLQTRSFERDQITIDGRFQPSEATEVAALIQSSALGAPDLLEFRPVVEELPAG